MDSSEKSKHEVAYSVSDVLNDVRASGCLGKSQRQFSLLEYLLNKSAVNEHMNVNQYAVAVDVMNRPESFDANIDSIVRVEMHRLRANLKNYSASGHRYTLKIPAATFQVLVEDVSKAKPNPFAFLKIPALAAAILVCGGFLAGFITHKTMGTNTPNSVQAACSKVIPNMRITNKGNVSEVQAYVDRLLNAAISQHTSLNLIDTSAICDTRAAPQFTLDYMVVERGENFDLSLTVYGDTPNDIIKSEHILGRVADQDPEGALYFRALKSINEMAKPYGVIARGAMSSDWSSETARLNYKCLVVVYDSFAAEAESDYQDAHGCLEQAAKTGIASADAYGALAASYIEQARNQRQTTVLGPYDEAAKILEKFDDNWLDSAELVMAKMAFETQREDYSPERLRAILSAAESKYNTNPHVLLSVSLYLGNNLGDWERAKELSDRVKLIHSERDQSVYVIDAAYAFMHSKPEEVIGSCVKFYSPNSPYSNLLINACANKANDTEWRDVTQANLVRLNIDTEDKKTAFLELLKFDRTLEREIVKFSN